MSIIKCRMWYNTELVKTPRGFKSTVLWFILVIYPLLVIPNSMGYFYFPRFVVLALAAIISVPGIYNSRKLPEKVVLLPLLAFIFIMLLSSLNAIDKDTAFIGLSGVAAIPTAKDNSYFIIEAVRFTGLSTYVFCAILFLLSYQVSDRTKLIHHMILGATVVSIIALFQHFKINIIPHEQFRDRFPPYGTIGQPNFFATYMVFILPAAIFQYLKLNKKFWLGCSSLIFAGLLVSLTRGAWIAFGGSALLFLIYCYKKREYRNSFVKIILALIVVTCILFPTNGGIIYKRFLSIPININSGMEFTDDAGSGRMFIWKNTVKLLPKYWVLGMGPDNLIYAGVSNGYKYVDKAHNIYLEIAITMGVFALAAYIIFLKNFIKQWHDDIGFMFYTMILTYLIQGFFNIDAVMVMPIFWIVLGLSINKNEN